MAAAAQPSRRVSWPTVTAIFGFALAVANILGYALENARAAMIVVDDGPPGPAIVAPVWPFIVGMAIAATGIIWENLAWRRLKGREPTPGDATARVRNAWRPSAIAATVPAGAVGATLAAWGVANPLHFSTATHPAPIMSVPDPIFLTGGALVALAIVGAAVLAFSRPAADAAPAGAPR